MAGNNTTSTIASVLPVLAGSPVLLGTLVMLGALSLDDIARLSTNPLLVLPTILVVLVSYYYKDPDSSTIFASGLLTGGIYWLYEANRLVAQASQLPGAGMPILGDIVESGAVTYSLVTVLPGAVVTAWIIAGLTVLAISLVKR